MKTILERAPEAEALQAAVTSAVRGAGRLVVIKGAAGMGKTTVLERGAARARGSGVRLLRATASVVETSLPYAVARQLFERSLLEPGGATSARGAAVLGMNRPGAGVADPYAASDALYWLTADLAVEDPLLLVVDDAHWADVPSLRFL